VHVKQFYTRLVNSRASERDWSVRKRAKEFDVSSSLLQIII
jgi:hypothetical protein